MLHRERDVHVIFDDTFPYVMVKFKSPEERAEDVKKMTPHRAGINHFQLKKICMAYH